MQSYEAGAWYLASFELTLLAEIPLSLAMASGTSLDAGEMLTCGVFMPFCMLFAPAAASEVVGALLVFLLDLGALLIAPAVTAGVADAADVQVDFPIVFTTGMSSAISLGFVGAGLSGDLPGLGMLVGGALGLAGGLTYSILRVDALARDPRLGVETNFLLWAPAIAGPLSALILAAAGADPSVTLLVSGIVGLLAIGASILAIELQLAEPAASPAPGPLVGGVPVLEF